MEHLPSSIPQFFGFGLILYAAYGAIYRLFLSPLAKIPGPRLAALTGCYEFYYDVIKRGRYTWKIAELHQEYGPIVRIGPEQIHINDPHFIDEIYPGAGRRTDKPERYANMFGISEAAFSTQSHDHHRTRRAMISPFFSKRSITRLEPVLQSAVNRLCHRLEGFQESGEPVNLRHAYMALSTDVINQYCFAITDNYSLDAPDFNVSWYRAIMEPSEMANSFRMLPWLFPIIDSMPHWLLMMMNPMAYKIVETKKNLETQVQNVMDEKTRSDNPAEHATIFHLILDAKGPPPERSLHRLGQEALSLVAAGSLTTAHALRTTTYHLLANPPILQTLLAELDDAIPGLAQPPPLQQLEKLPYLSAVITEGLRIGYGIVHRLERSFPDRALIYGPYTIPPNTPVSMSTVLVHDNPDIFPSPRTFNPDRWLQSKDKIVDSEDGHHHRLDKFLLTFSRGTRGCVGLNLAYAELYLTLANVFRRFQLELYEVVRERDVDLHHDFFNPCESLQSKGLRARVVGMRA